MSQIIAASCAQKLAPVLIGSRPQAYDYTTSGMFGAKNVLPLELERAGNDSHEVGNYARVQQDIAPPQNFQKVQKQVYSSKSVEDIENWLKNTCESFAIETTDDSLILPRCLYNKSSGEHPETDSSAIEDIHHEEASASSEKENETVLQSCHQEYFNKSTQMTTDINNENFLTKLQGIGCVSKEVEAVEEDAQNDQEKSDIDPDKSQYLIDDIHLRDPSINDCDENIILEDSQSLPKDSPMTNESRNEVVESQNSSGHIILLQFTQTEAQIKNNNSELRSKFFNLKSHSEPKISVQTQSPAKEDFHRLRRACALISSNLTDRRINLDHSLCSTERIDAQNTSFDKTEKQRFILKETELDSDSRGSEITNLLQKFGITNVILKNFKKRNQSSEWHCYSGECNRRFSKLCDLKIHLLSHVGARPFKCDHDGCSWAFYTEFKLKRHKETHLKKKDFQCLVPGCGRRFTTIYNLTSHQKLHSRPEKISCKVDGCNAKFQTKRAAELHMKIHDVSFAPYVCDFENCGKRYFTNNTLTSHQRSHTHSQSDLICSWPGCGKVFDLPCRLKTHMRSHTGTKPYVCTFKGCKWAFPTSSKLSRHQRKHTNDRKFICDVGECRKAFMRPDHLKEHKFTHSLERLFQCHLCPSAFNAKSSLYVHLKKHKNRDFGDICQEDKRKDIEEKSASQEIEVPCSRVQPICSSRNRTKKRDCMGECNNQQTNDHQTKLNIKKDQKLRSWIPRSDEAKEKSPQQTSSLRTEFNRTGRITEQHRVSPQKRSASTSSDGSDSINEFGNGKITEQNHLQVQRTSRKKHDKQSNESINSLFHNNEEYDRVSSQPRIPNEGSARTSFTKEVIFNSKLNRISPAPKIRGGDLVLNDIELEEFPDFPDDLPSTCCQSDIEIPDYQLLLLNPNFDEEVNNPEQVLLMPQTSIPVV